MKFEFPKFEMDRYASIIKKDIPWLKENLHENYTHIHSNGSIENKEVYIKNINSDNIAFETMQPLEWRIREEIGFVFITGTSNFKLKYFDNFLDLNLAYHSIWKLDSSPRCFSWQATNF